jgi:hypothetical protein
MNYLTQKENLPQLAKLGYMYNTLWYGGRLASYDNIIEKEPIDEGDGEIYMIDQCDENPKYKIEMCEPQSEEIDNYIYDAWGMHVSNDYSPGWTEFCEIITNGRELSDIETKTLKQNKTFDEWVEIMTSPDYKYSSMFPDRRSVANHLLCVIGNGYGFKKGFVIKEASGADQDTTDYGDWMNAKFHKDIQKMVDNIMSDPEVKKVLTHVEKKKSEYEEEQLKKERKAFDGMTYDEFMKIKNNTRIRKTIHEYYPISEYSIITKINNNSHPSYIQAGIEVCEDLLANPPKYKENYNKYQKEQCDYQVEFAKNFLDKFKGK